MGQGEGEGGKTTRIPSHRSTRECKSSSSSHHDGHGSRTRPRRGEFDKFDSVLNAIGSLSAKNEWRFSWGGPRLISSLKRDDPAKIGVKTKHRFFFLGGFYRVRSILSQFHGPFQAPIPWRAGWDMFVFINTPDAMPSQLAHTLTKIQEQGEMLQA